MLEVGSLIDGKYRILSQVGRGGMSTVYLAINAKANKPWAIKEVRKDGVQNFEVVRQSLLVETDLLKKLEHPNLPSIVDIIDQDENFLIVMDYIEGITLNKVIQESGAQKQEDVVAWALQLCDVLCYLHSRTPAIIYRDMKPSNIMLKYDGSVVLVDFGTAREFKERNVADTTCLGTQGYAAPEQFGGMGQTDARTDIYCLGATMYHLLTGHNPSEPPYEMYPITYWNPALSSGLENIILRCTQKNPQDRYQSAEELMYALEHYRDLDRPILKKYKQKIGMFAASLGLAAACGAASLGFYISAKDVQESEYDYLINIAERSTDREEMIDYYLQAIATDSTRNTGYQGLIDLFIEDGIFSEDEEQILLRINASVDKYMENFSDKNPSEYADFCFDIGNAYWFYYEKEESRQSNAVIWFRTASNYYENDSDREMEYKRCEIYVEIGNFYKRIVAAQIDGTDVGMYGDYWSKLVELKHYNDEIPDRDLITLRLYKEIVSRSTQYAKYMKEDGVLLEDIQTVYKEIDADLDKMSKNVTGNVAEEIVNVKALIEQSNELLTSSYKGEE